MNINISELPIVAGLLKLVPHFDFEGQKLSEKIYQCVIVLFAIVGFIWGFVCQQFDQTVYIIGAGFILASLLILPPWPFYRRNPLEWENGETAAPNKKNTNSGGNKGGKKGRGKS